MKTIVCPKGSEAGLNPFRGFTSFQHFSGEKLYSDIVVRPENKMCETENVECYPIPDDVPQNGREEGYYPDSSVAYFRVLWKEFEPEQGVYNYALIEDLLDQARAHNQSVTFRLLPHSTRARDDVPDWLKALIPCPERPDGMRVKDSPTDPLFLILFGKAIEKLGEHFDSDPTFHTIDICLPGAWGEGHKLENYPDEDIKRLVDTFLTAFPNTNLVAQIGLPWLVNYANSVRPVGWRGDGCGSPNHLNVLYPNHVSQLTPDLWKTAPVSFESYWWIGEWQRQGWDLDAIIEKTLGWHLSVFNAKSIPAPFSQREKIDRWLSKMGYHLSFNSFSYPETVKKGEEARFSLTVDNDGVAPLYEKLPVMLRLKNEQGTFLFDTRLKPIDWLPGQTASSFSVRLPDNLASGRYELSLGIYSESVKAIYFGNDIAMDGPFYPLCSIDVD